MRIFMRIMLPPIIPLHHNILSSVMSHILSVMSWLRWLLILIIFLGLIVAKGFRHGRDWPCQVQAVLDVASSSGAQKPCIEYLSLPLILAPDLDHFIVLIVASGCSGLRDTCIVQHCGGSLIRFKWC